MGGKKKKPTPGKFSERKRVVERDSLDVGVARLVKKTRGKRKTGQGFQTGKPRKKKLTLRNKGSGKRLAKKKKKAPLPAVGKVGLGDHKTARNTQ